MPVGGAWIIGRCLPNDAVHLHLAATAILRFARFESEALVFTRDHGTATCLKLLLVQTFVARLQVDVRITIDIALSRAFAAHPCWWQGWIGIVILLTTRALLFLTNKACWTFVIPIFAASARARLFKGLA
jgi:hypothetical protein